MVSGQEYSRADSVRLSVLALSSRFDGPRRRAKARLLMCLSVLALSSRFDGPICLSRSQPLYFLSVLALSSRFDGREPAQQLAQPDSSFSTRSVESF